MTVGFETIIAILSALGAIAAASFAWWAAHTAKKSYGVELIRQLYTLYQTDEMSKSLTIVWRIYKQLWIKEVESEEVGMTKANNGVPLPLESAVLFFNNLAVESDEAKAIHYTINFWTYLELLLKKKALNPQEIKIFTSPYILGFLMPISKAYATRYPDPNEDDTTLEYAYEVLVAARKRR